MENLKTLEIHDRSALRDMNFHLDDKLYELKTSCNSSYLFAKIQSLFDQSLHSMLKESVDQVPQQNLDKVYYRIRSIVKEITSYIKSHTKEAKTTPVDLFSLGAIKEKRDYELRNETERTKMELIGVMNKVALNEKQIEETVNETFAQAKELLEFKNKK